MLLAELLAASERVAATRSRLAKIDALAECLRRLDVSEIALGVAYLSGDTRQGKIGIGYASLKDALTAAPARAPSSRSRKLTKHLRVSPKSRERVPPPSANACSPSSLRARPPASRISSRACSWASCARARSKGSCSMPSRKLRTCPPRG